MKRPNWLFDTVSSIRAYCEVQSTDAASQIIPSEPQVVQMSLLMRLFLASVLLGSALACAAAPRHWDVMMNAFDRVFQHHPKCLAVPAQLSDMECSNFRARALKRFQVEWQANSFWQNGQFVRNEAAARRVNAELPKARTL